MGRNRTSAAVLRARGSWRAKGRAPSAVPSGIPTAPDWLSDAGRRFWPVLIDACRAAGTLSECYGTILALVAEALAAYVAARDEALAVGSTATVTAAGSAIQHPAIGAAHKRWGMVLTGLKELGVTPKSSETVARTVEPAADDGRPKLFVR